MESIASEINIGMEGEERKHRRGKASNYLLILILLTFKDEFDF
jgi:hypothetical protein